MKKLTLIFLLALMLTGCGKAPVQPVTTAPQATAGETTIATEATTAPTTLPPETTVATEPAVETTIATEPSTEPEAPSVTAPDFTNRHEHIYTATEIPATCTAPGTTAYFCACGDNYTEGKTPPQGHSFGDWVLIEPGLEQRVCADCGETEENYIG